MNPLEEGQKENIPPFMMRSMQEIQKSHTGITKMLFGRVRGVVFGVVFERGVRAWCSRMSLLSYFNYVTQITRHTHIAHSHCKKITRKSTLECTLDFDKNKY